ncbi:SPOR domain-containing protein [Mesorhizobium australicum]|uniref:Sporulation related domain-containing protein n=1 Tax=Mesorhizobium australicum TaxID=536018 RepID=A0A1X7PCM4_9HYPH|nr:SPOR domain-containing protein [Mesorhizobium australicum]SMH49058.1 Sporulation related domain-containing protein [Mesorhizobium australicum]
MASKTVLKAAHPSEFPETDPLAELSRIMGLAKEEAAANSSEADFEIDLEQELMGELFGEEPAADVEARAPQPEEGVAEFETLQADFDDAFADMLAETAEEQAPEPVAATVETDVDLQAMEAALGNDLADLDAAFEDFDLAAGMDQEVSAHIEQDAVDVEVDDTVGQTLEGMAVEDHIADVDHLVEQEYVADERLAVEDDFAADDLIEDIAAFVEEDAVVPEAQAAVAEDVELRAAEPQAVAEPAAVVPAPTKSLSIEDELRQLLGRTGNAHVLPQPDTVSAISEEVTEPEVSVVEAVASADPVAHDATAHYQEPAYEEPADLVTVEETVAEEVVAVAQEDVTAEMPAFDDFTFDQADLDHDDLAAELERTLAGGEAAAEVVAEADEEQQLDAAEMAFDPAEQLEAAAEVEDDPVIDLEAELAPHVEPQPMTRENAGPSTAAKPATLRPLAFTEERRAVEEERPAAPVFDWRQRYAEMKSAEAGRPEPVAERAAPAPVAPELDDADPFAALAALAAQPPIVRSLSRSNPVANPNATGRENLRPVAPAPSAAPIAAEPAAAARPDFSSWRTQAAPQREVAAVPVARPAPVPMEPPRAEAPRPASPYAAPKSDMPFAPRAGLAASAAGSVAASAFAPAPAAAKPAPQPQIEDEFPDLADLLDDANFAPDIETVEISDQAVALADELDIPDLAFDEPNVTPAGFDDLDADFATAFQQLSRVPEPKATPPAARSVAQPDPGAGYYVERAAEPARATYPSQHAAQSTQYAPVTDYDDQLAGFQLDQGGEPPYGEDDDAFAGDFYGEEIEKEQPKRSRGLLIAAMLAGVAVIGGIGAYAFTGGSGGDGAPALVKADPSPIKVKPENPGGAIVPNQDGKVYEQVRGQPAAATSQDKLVSGAEEPMAPPPAARPAAPAANSAANPPAAAEQPTAALPGVETPTVKSEERVTPEETAQGSEPSQEVAAIAPKKVRTMIVRPDGTLVPREDPPAVASGETTGTAMATVPTNADPATMAAAQPGAQVPSAVPGARDDVSILPPDAAADDSAAGLQTPAASDVIVPLPRPSRTAQPAAEEPVRQAAVTPAPVRAEPAPQPAAPAAQEASAPAATAPVAGLWTVQIASQPTREGAQASYEDLARRYGGVLGGKGVNIIQAEVSGKGTMWRVRVPAASKNDANILCAKLKTAGGSCFVTQ